jgi:protein-S-isoprenylcysteine O-methyltransferase Ste14
VVIFPFVVDRVFIRVEERMLAETFGREWEEYRARVRRWI